ncbi:hypothetical protein L3X39_12575 [Sabulilitoribacter multivorans]|uniref:Peptidase M56 domain-containing protein n=1 Tax=Flaviramulus multivorans TaxID=1304750 RepID=A0ABS9ILK2_9FLAO|nr:M56 family metallopeptidase [Flaviramulus multivorans]MCF7561474.1 hypothetical protein [Flaviramulus multivorans]
MEYLLKVSAVIAIFYFSYKLFLQRDTFFEQNRWFLLVGLIASFLVPFFVINEYIEYKPITINHYNFEDATHVETAKNSFNVFDYLPIIYILGVTFFTARFLIQISSLFLLIFNNKGYKNGAYTFIETKANVSPFSFFNWIVYNPNQFSESELQQIITHEKIHVQQYHSIDILLTQLACILLWFNPFIWFYNKDLKQNLEFLADHAAINFSNCKKAYQYTLLKTSLPNHQLALSNNFYNSLIKKRIVMLHKTKSKKINQIKFALVIPLLVIFLMSFNTKKVYVEKEIPIKEQLNTSNTFLNNDVLFTEKNVVENNHPKTNPKSKTKTVAPALEQTKSIAKGDKEMVLITKDFKDADFEKLKSKLKKEGFEAKFKGIKRNNDGEITAIKIEVSSKQSNVNYNIDSDDAIKPIKITYDKDGGNISIGNSSSKHIVHASGKGKAFFISDDDEVHEVHTEDIHFTTKGDKTKHIKIRKNKDVEIITGDEEEDNIFIIKKSGKGDNIFISDDEDNEVEINVESDGVSETEDIIVTKGKGGKAYKIKTIAKDKGDSKFIISTDGDKEPLYIIDGKEVKKDKLDDLNPDDIESINVLKGDAAIKKHGDKAKDGVVEIITKNKN